MRRGDREPPAPTPLDEVVSALTLHKSPWIQQRIRQLRLTGRKVQHWTPPCVTVRGVDNAVCFAR